MSILGHLSQSWSDLVRTHETRPWTPGGQERRSAPRDSSVAQPRFLRRSLYADILDFMFAPLALIWPLSVVLTFLVARSLADAPFDRALEERVRTLANYLEIVRSVDRSQPIEIPSSVLGQSSADRSLFQIATATGSPIAGDAALPRPTWIEAGNEDQIRSRTASYRSRDWRIAWTWVGASPRENGQVLVQVAESLERRNALANEIIRGVIVPQFLILPLAVLLVWFGLARGLHPLKAMQQDIRARLPDDYSPIEQSGAPEELTPLLLSFNDLLRRLDSNMEVQRRFIADAAHQLKTPLAGLRTQAELALKADDPGELRSSLKQIARSAERTARVVSQLLSLARTEQAAHEVASERVDMTALGRSVVEEWLQAAMRRRIDLGIEDTGRPMHVIGRPLLLRELLGNLVDNAIRYTPGGGAVTLRLRVPAGNDSILRAEVEDDGKGIAPEDQSRVFDRFYRVLGNESEGSGLGLPIVREIADQHDASIHVESPVGTRADGSSYGTRFVLQIPLATADGGRGRERAATGNPAQQ